MPFQKGDKWKGNAKGRPPAEHKQRLLEAIEAVEKKKNKSFFMHLVERAYENDQVLTDLSGRLIPKLKSMEVTGKDGEKLQALVVIKSDGDKT